MIRTSFFTQTNKLIQLIGYNVIKPIRDMMKAFPFICLPVVHYAFYY